MKRSLKIIVAAVAIAAALAASALAAPVTAHLAKLKGDVTVKAASAQEWTAAKEGGKISQGDSVKCGKDSQVFVVWGGNSVKINSLTEITFTDFSQEGGVSKTALKLKEGSIFSKVAKLNKTSTYNVATPIAVSGVRGTAYEAAVDKFSVVEGSISVTAKETETVVDTGKFVEITAEGILGQTEALSESMMQPLKQDLNECNNVIGEQTTMQDTGATINDVAETTTNIIPSTEQLPELLPGHGGFQINVDISH